MGFMDKAKKMAEQAQAKLEEAQKQFNESQSQSSAGSGPAVEYDKHGRPIAQSAPVDTAGRGAPSITVRTSTASSRARRAPQERAASSEWGETTSSGPAGGTAGGPVTRWPWPPGGASAAWPCGRADARAAPGR